jgi:hypothetical protein
MKKFSSVVSERDVVMWVVDRAIEGYGRYGLEGGGMKRDVHVMWEFCLWLRGFDYFGCVG